MKAVFYARVSTHEEGQISALKKQIEDLNKCINENNWILVDKYIDEGKSGTTSKNRTEYNRLYNDLMTDKFDIVVVTHQDRLIRNTLDWYLFIDRLVKNNKRIYFTLEHKFYEPDDALITGIKAIIASQYSRDLSKKIYNAHKRRQKKGKPLINSRMWGYDVTENGDIVINEREANIIRDIFNMYIEGKGYRTILRILTERGIKNRNGKEFSITTLKRIIKNEKYKGTLISNKKTVNFDTKKVEINPKSEWIIQENAFPAIVSEEVWNRANEILKSKKKIYKQDEVQKQIIAGYFKGNKLYSGKIKCDKCGQVYWHQTYGTKKKASLWQCSTYRKYGKMSCDNPSITTSELDQIVKQIIFDFWQNKETNIQKVIDALDTVLSSNNYNNTVKKLTQDKIKIEQKKNKLIELYTDNLINKSEFKNKNNDYNLKLEEIEKQIEEFENKNKNILDKKSRLAEIQKYLNKKYKDKDGIDDELVKYFLKEVIIKENNELDIILNGDFEFIAKKMDNKYTYENVSPIR